MPTEWLAPSISDKVESICLTPTQLQDILSLVPIDFHFHYLSSLQVTYLFTFISESNS